MSTLVNKLVTAALEMCRQYSYHIRETDSETKYLIQVLSLQAITQSKIRLTADNLMLLVVKNIILSQTTSLTQKTASSFSSLTQKSTSSFNSLIIDKKKSSILDLIKDIQEFDLQCRQISSQLHEKSEENSSFALIRNEILRKMNYVFIFQQKTIQS